MKGHGRLAYLGWIVWAWHSLWLLCPGVHAVDVLKNDAFVYGSSGFSPVRLKVSDEPARLYEPAVWTVTVVNSSPLTYQHAEVNVCFPLGTQWIQSNVPTQVGKVRVYEPACVRHFIGTIHGHSERAFNITFTSVHGVKYPAIARDVSLTLSAIPVGQERQEHLFLMKVPVDPDMNSLLVHDVRITGRVYIDVNGSGQYEEGEPTVPLAEIIVNDLVVATTNQSGVYRAVIPADARILWARSASGSSSLIPLQIGALPPLHTVQQDLGISPEGGMFSDENLRWERRFSFAGGFVTHPLTQGEMTTEGGRGVSPLTGSARFGAHIMSKLMQTIAFVQWSERGPAWRLQSEGRWNHSTLDLSWSVEGFRGEASPIRSEHFRPSMPVHQARIIRVQSLVPKGRLFIQGEAVYFEGDVWSCSGAMIQADMFYDSVTLGGRTDVAFHRAASRRGMQREFAFESEIHASFWREQGWPWTFQIIHGQRRRVSPSCGLSPAGGTRWRALTSAPVVSSSLGVLDAFHISGVVIPSAHSHAEHVGTKSDSAHEAFFQVAPRRQSTDSSLSGSYTPATWTVGAGLQWRQTSNMNQWLPLLRLETAVDPGHLFSARFGPPPAFSLEQIKPIDGLQLGLAWSRQNGSLRPWIDVELVPTRSARSFRSEIGLEGHTRLTVPFLQDMAADMTARLSRAVRATSFLDTISFRVRANDWDIQSQWTIRTPFRERVSAGQLVGGTEGHIDDEESADDGSDRITWTGHITFSDIFHLTHDSILAPTGLTWQTEARLSSGWPGTRFAIGKGLRIEHATDRSVQFDLTMISISTQVDKWHFGIELQDKRSLTPFISSTTTIETEIKRVITDELAVIAIRLDSGDKLRHSIGIDWTPGAANALAPFPWTLRTEMVWDALKARPNGAPGLVVGLVVPAF